MAARTVAAAPDRSMPKQQIERKKLLNGSVIAVLSVGLVVASVVAIGVGKLSIPPLTVVNILAHDLGEALGLVSDSGAQAWTDGERSAVTLIRAPRVLMAMIVGGALAVSGAALQAVFRNPLVSPDVIGVSSGSAFGGVLAILLGAGTGVLLTGSFVAGLLAALGVMVIGKIRTMNPILTIVLGGIVVSAFFNALVSLITYVADPYTTLPNITFWLMGSFTAASWVKLAMVAVPVAIGSTVVFALRWRINLLTMGDEDAMAMGVNPERIRIVLITSVSLLTAATVAVAGVVGWVGLVVPHLVRLVVGSDNRIVLPASFLLGALYLLGVDTLARSLGEAEIPVGILTALIGAPVFIGMLIQKSRRGGSLA